jgi:DNA-binding XRE family transcriptional regulator
VVESKHSGARIWQEFQGRKTGGRHGEEGAGDGLRGGVETITGGGGLSQAALVERAGMNVFGVAKIEQGLREPGWATVLKLAAALGVECTAFCEEVSEKGRRK